MSSTAMTAVAAIQCSFGRDMHRNIDKVITLIEQAAEQGANIVLVPELFQGEYFCTAQDESWFKTAFSVAEHPCVIALQKIAKKCSIVIPVSIFERDGPDTYNSVVMLDHCGEIMGVYRKSHIPDGPGYMEKYYFRPGNTGYKVWKTVFGNIGVGICWDQWFPECAQQMMLQGADILLYPTAIGSEPYDDNLHTAAIWQRVMQGHAVANAVPIVAANRIGMENANSIKQCYYGHSFIADQTGELVQQLGEKEEGLILQSFDFSALQTYRSSWGFFRDRRSDLNLL
ncbi:MAG: N-carbamoylputrescine amidase [Pseudomonadales bacterium]|nr:N-carbamoylputrescine amidase [Pseudomonadales bacterium]